MCGWVPDAVLDSPVNGADGQRDLERNSNDLGSGLEIVRLVKVLNQPWPGRVPAQLFLGFRT